MATQFKVEPAKVRVEFENGKSQTFDCFNSETSDEMLFTAAQTFGAFNVNNVAAAPYTKLETKKLIMA